MNIQDGGIDPLARSKILDVVGDHPLKKGDPIGSIKAEEAVMAEIQQSDAGADRPVFLKGIPKMKRQDPSLFFDEIGPPGPVQFCERRLLRHRMINITPFMKVDNVDEIPV